jgi:tetratricopeptide (TPR) repeat protein
VAEEVQSAVKYARRRFAAFISYAHADAFIAAKLQAKLERYRLPKHLAQSHTCGQTALGQIFRDREDLAAAPSLSDAIRDAISEAEALVVICSPDAAASRWVGEEIALFRSLHPDRPILAAVVRGAPEDAFPAALTEGGNEPLAADLRKEADGPSLGFLKIVAGIAGVPLDALVQRDAQRRIRRVMWITGSALAAMLIMGIMTTLALSARNEAARQRAASDGLVEYMLTDLREKLRGVGRSEIMDGVNKTALAHYATQGPLDRLPDESISHRARVLHAIGDDDERAGRLDDALSRFSEAHLATQTLLARDPHNPDRIFAHAQSEYYVGRIAFLKKNYHAAGRHWRGYLSQAKALSALEPNTFRSSMELGYAEGNLCELVLADKTNIAVAERHCRSAIAHEQKALTLKPNDSKTKQDLANRWGWLAQVHFRRKKWSDAIESRRQEKQLIESLLSADPANAEFAIRKSWTDIGIAMAYNRSGRTSEAYKIVASALVNFDKASASVTGDTRIAEGRFRLLCNLAYAERAKTGTASAQTLAKIDAMIAGTDAAKFKMIFSKTMGENTNDNF